MDNIKLLLDLAQDIYRRKLQDAECVTLCKEVRLIQW